VPEVLDERDGPDVEVAGHQGVVQPVGGVLGQLDVEQRAGLDQPPVEREAVEELDVAHSRAPG
jgi:hypothetical protein